VIAALQQLKDLHRNVLFHPEESLDTDGAVALIGISQSVVSAMIQDIPVVAVDYSVAKNMSAIDANTAQTEPVEDVEMRRLGDALAELAGGKA
jgi:hypothetical protein